MKTLLKIFFLDYLGFLFKVHLYIFVAIFFIFALKISELTQVAPQLYAFVNYIFMTRHTFKQNISWMLASFNKKDLIKYHLLSQTMMMALLIFMNTIFTISFVTLKSFYFPPESELQQQVVEVTKSTSEAETLKALDIMNIIEGYWSTRETIWIYFAFFFLSYLVYSPVNPQEKLRKMQQMHPSLKMKFFLILYLSLGLLSLVFVYFNLHEHMIPILSLLAAGALFYIVHVYNSTFLFTKTKTLLKIGTPVFFLIFMVFNFWFLHKSKTNFYETKNPDRKLRELDFMGVFAPDLSKEQLLKLMAKASFTSSVTNILDHHYFGTQISYIDVMEYFNAYPSRNLARVVMGNISRIKLDQEKKNILKENLEWLVSINDKDRKIEAEEAKNYLTKLNNDEANIKESQRDVASEKASARQ